MGKLPFLNKINKQTNKKESDQDDFNVLLSLTKFQIGFLPTIGPWLLFSYSIYFRKCAVVNSFSASKNRKQNRSKKELREKFSLWPFWNWVAVKRLPPFWIYLFYDTFQFSYLLQQNYIKEHQIPNEAPEIICKYWYYVYFSLLRSISFTKILKAFITLKNHWFKTVFFVYSYRANKGLKHFSHSCIWRFCKNLKQYKYS